MITLDNNEKKREKEVRFSWSNKNTPRQTIMEATRAVIPTVIAGTTGQLQHQNLGIVNDDDDVLFSHFNNNGDEDSNNNEFEKELDKMWKRTMKDIRNLDPNRK